MLKWASAIGRELTQAALEFNKIAIFKKDYGVCCQMTVLAILARALLYAVPNLGSSGNFLGAAVVRSLSSRPKNRNSLLKNKNLLSRSRDPCG